MSNPLNNCEKCGGRMLVVEKRNRKSTIYRRRKCESCDHRVTTQEFLTTAKISAMPKNSPAPTLIAHLARRHFQSLPPKEQVAFLDELYK